MNVMRPGPRDRVLDVGVSAMRTPETNYFESMYPWPSQLTAVAIDEEPSFRVQFPDVTLVIADGRNLPIADHAFDIGFSNAVVEHVGSRAKQRQFVSELLRTCRRVFISTPNARFPVDPHSLLPFVHWLPRRLRHPILRWTGNGNWASEEALNPLSERELVAMFPEGVEVRIIRQRLLGITSVITAIGGWRTQCQSPMVRTELGADTTWGDGTA